MSRSRGSDTRSTRPNLVDLDWSISMTSAPIQSPTDHGHQPWGWGVRAVLSAVGVLTLCLGGCYKPFLTEDDQRSQYDAYDSVRNQYAKRYTFDEFGNRRPNLKARLLRDD